MAHLIGLGTDKKSTVDDKGAIRLTAALSW